MKFVQAENSYLNLLCKYLKCFIAVLPEREMVFCRNLTIYPKSFLLFSMEDGKAWDAKILNQHTNTIC